MNGQEWLAEQFEANRGHLRAVAYRMLGSVNEADDAVQETWLRLSRADTQDVENLTGWLTTVVARVCLDLLRSRKSRREESLDGEVTDLPASGETQDPEHEALLADSVGLALLVVLDTLTPAERLAFVLHDMFAVSFDEIGRIVGRTPAAARQLASRARRRIQGVTSVPSEDLRRQREVIDAFLTALRAGDFEGLLAVLDPDVVVHADPGAGRPGAPAEIRGARNWAQGAVTFSRMARFLEPALVNGSVGLIFAPRGRLLRALSFRIDGGKIVEAEIIAKPERLDQLQLSVVE
jgi:RNA polymerase sigma-70 factor (ECF subfamily)